MSIQTRFDEKWVPIPETSCWWWIANARQCKSGDRAVKLMGYPSNKYHKLHAMKEDGTMAKKPETAFYRGIHKLLPHTVYRVKMYNPLTGGIPDVWYSGNLDDLWVEYKWIAKVPKKALIRLDKLLSPLQQRWLEERHEEGRNIVVILGSPEGAWIFEGAAWKEPLDPVAIRTVNASKQNVADYIEKRTQLR
jgi:hypothetical protein